MTAVSAFSAVRPGSGKPGRQLPFLSLGILSSTLPARVSQAGRESRCLVIGARRAPLTGRGAAQALDLERDGPLGDAADHLAQEIGIGTLFWKSSRSAILSVVIVVASSPVSGQVRHIRSLPEIHAIPAGDPR